MRWTVAMMAAVALAGCGGDSDGAHSGAVPDFRHARCLDRAGVTFARDLEQLGFFQDAVRSDEADKPAIAFVENYSIGVEQWEKTGGVDEPPGTPPGWVLLQAQPFGQQKTVSQIVRQDPPRSYVAYVRDPSQRQLDLIDRCLTPTRAEVERAKRREGN